MTAQAVGRPTAKPMLDGFLDFLAETMKAVTSVPLKRRRQWILVGALVLAMLVAVGIAIVTQR